jgi:methylglutaconyl-CoA hydratase
MSAATHATHIRRIDLGDAMPGVAEIVLDRPDKRNAQTPAMLAEIARLAHEISADPSIRAIVVRGEGPVFCAGFDLELCRDDATVLPDLLRNLSAAIRALRRARQPVVLAARGAAIAGGCALFSGADLVVSHGSAKLGYPAVLLGISPAVTGPGLRQSVTDPAARRALLLPELLSGEEARRLGLVHQLVDTPEDVVPRAQIEASKFAQKPPDAIAATKRWLNELDGSLDDAAFDAALQASLDLAGSDEQRQLLDAALRR